MRPLPTIAHSAKLTFLCSRKSVVIDTDTHPGAQVHHATPPFGGGMGVGENMFPVWKTIKLGTNKTIIGCQTYYKALLSHRNYLDDDTFARITFTKEETDIKLVVLSVADLGFKKGSWYGIICSKAEQLGLELCPAEVGPALCLQYNDQPQGETLHIAMREIAFEAEKASWGYHAPRIWIFGVSRTYSSRSGLWPCRGALGEYWEPHCLFVFKQSKVIR